MKHAPQPCDDTTFVAATLQLPCSSLVVKVSGLLYRAITSAAKLVNAESDLPAISEISATADMLRVDATAKPLVALEAALKECKAAVAGEWPADSLDAVGCSEVGGVPFLDYMGKNKDQALAMLQASEEFYTTHKQDFEKRLLTKVQVRAAWQDFRTSESRNSRTILFRSVARSCRYATASHQFKSILHWSIGIPVFGVHWGLGAVALPPPWAMGHSGRGNI